jgi:hypothetical protein
LFERFKPFNRCARFKSFTGNRAFNPASFDDLRESRLYLVDPAPIPPDELQRTYDWMKSWDFLETAPCATNLVDMNA